MATTSALTGGVPPRRFEFSTTDPDQAQDFIGQMYRAQPPRAGRLDRASPVSVSQVSAGGLSHVDITMPPDLTLHLDGTDDLSVTTLVTGGVHAELGKHTERYRAGDVCLGTFPRGDYVVRCVDFRAEILTVPAAAVAQVTGSMPDRPLPALRFGSLRPASPAAAEHWRRTTAFVRDLLANDEAASSPLVVGNAARMLAATVLAVFPNSLPTGPTPPDSRDARPDTVRRAVAFIEENAHTDITVADIAAAAFVTPRAVQLAFRRHLDLTPMAYLRQVRLGRAHQDLLAGGGAVTSVAHRWGYAHANRFAADYRRAYGVPPSETLRKNA